MLASSVVQMALSVQQHAGGVPSRLVQICQSVRQELRSTVIWILIWLQCHFRASGQNALTAHVDNGALLHLAAANACSGFPPWGKHSCVL